MFTLAIVKITFAWVDDLVHAIIGKVTFTLSVHLLFDCRLLRWIKKIVTMFAILRLGGNLVFIFYFFFISIISLL